MEPRYLGPQTRYGTLWSRAVLRPFAEQVAAALVLRPGEVVVDLGDDDGTTAELLRRRGIAVALEADRAVAPRDPGTAPGRVAALVALRGGMSSPPPRLRLEAAHALGARQSLICTWDAAPHESALRGVFDMSRLEGGEAGPRRWPDVVRFDTVDHLWAAALGRLDVARRGALMSSAQLASARQSLGRLLAGYLTADATLRIPATMWVR